MSQQKTCAQCDAPKDLKEFTNHPGFPDGKMNKCKTCVKEKRTTYKMSPRPFTYQRLKVKTATDPIDRVLLNSFIWP